VRSPTDGSGRPRRANRQLLDLLPKLMSGSALTREEELAQELIETALKLLRDGTNVGDLKLVNSSIRELRYAFKVFQPYRGTRKVTTFGSARTPPESPAYRTAMEFSRRITEHGFMVITGAGEGIMGACLEGAGRDRSFGANIRLPFEQSANPFIIGDPKLVTFRHFFTRKLMFVKEADAVVLFPGGFGTLDECFETLTLVQTGKSRPIPMVFVDSPRGTYWRSWMRYVRGQLLRAKLISEDDLSLFTITDDVERAVDEVVRFYRVYHSSRFVRDRFVIRLTRPLDPELVAELSRDFADFVGPKGLVQRDAFADERRQEPDLDSLPRLACRTTHGRAGRLRQLIDRINREG
jgi:hypothetical protein